MQMQVMNGHYVGQDDRSNEVSTTTMITTMDRRARSIGEMLSQKLLFDFGHFLDCKVFAAPISQDSRATKHNGKILNDRATPT